MKINAPFVEKILTSFIREELAKFDYRHGILGLSGGLDSTVCAFLAARALGRRHVTGLIMPYGKSFGPDIKDARRVAAELGIRSEFIDIRPMVDAYFRKYPTSNRVLKGNKMARERMSILYDFSAREHSLILGTSNKTELLIGYGTIHGDMACAINPLGDLYKTQIKALALHLGVPESILNKQPTAGLWPGQSDEGEIGLSYAELDEILYALVDQRKSRAEVLSAGVKKKAVEKVLAMIKRSEFKRQLPPIAKISGRTLGHDFLYAYDRDH